MLLSRVVALVARIDLAAAGEPEPAVALLVVCAGATSGQRLARVQAQLLLASPWTRRRRQGQAGARRVGEEPDVWDLEREAAVAFPAHICSRLTTHRH